MHAAKLRELIGLARGEQPASEPFEVPAEHYTSEAHLAAERPLFARPRILAVSSEIAPGACFPIGDLLLVRAPDRTLRAFANACRHRATRLVDTPCAAKAIVCPYHGWTYDLTGELLHVPHAESFAGRERGRSLLAAPVCERHGLVWSGEPVLGELAADLDALALDEHVVWQRAEAVRAFNWKLAIDAFLESYHIRVLHRDSVYPYFVDAASSMDLVGPHVRAVTLRKPRGEPSGELRELATPSLFLFPATIVIEHPDFVSILTLEALAADRTRYRHAMLVPAARAGEVEHWRKNWQIIEDSVFQREDFWVCEQIQLGLAVGATRSLLFGALERAVGWFHAQLAR
jgi:phenylpropionate dioxygenase-like ring-hydroxylating dioxygenase large terminal subunit